MRRLLTTPADGFGLGVRVGMFVREYRAGHAGTFIIVEFAVHCSR